jgi:hypothetical protein
MSPERRRELAADTLYHISRCDHNADQIAAIESVFLEIEREVREECAKVADEMDCAMFCGVGHEVGTRIREGK